MNKCLCGGKLKFYSGALGYEALECQECGFMWDARNEEEHTKQKKEYANTKEITLKQNYKGVKKR